MKQLAKRYEGLIVQLKEYCTCQNLQNDNKKVSIWNPSNQRNKIISIKNTKLSNIFQLFIKTLIKYKSHTLLPGLKKSNIIKVN